MKKKKFLSALVAAIMTVTSLTACGGSSDSTTAGTTNGNTGDTADTSSTAEYKKDISVALAVEPPTLDPHTSGATAVRDVTRYIFECLFELDSSYSPKPQLAESYTVNDDYTEFEFKLREGVKFHNGDEMKAEDVVVSLNRWLITKKTDYAARAILTDDGFYKIDDYTVGIKLNQSCVTLLELLACPAQAPVIMPEEVITAAGEGDISEYIGTGSLKFDEYVQTQYIKMSRFEDYQAPTDENGNVYALDGQWGDRNVNFDSVTFYFVSDSQVRLAGVQNGEYDILTNLDYEDIDSAKLTGLQMITDMGCNGGVSFNLIGGLFKDDNLRAAAYYAMSPEELSAGSILDSDYYYTDSCYLAPESKWHTDVSDDTYGQNVELAKQYLADANYDGTPVTILATSAYPELYRASLILEQELEAVGFTVKIETYDWSNWISKVITFDGFDVFVMSYAVMYTPTNCSYLYSALTGLAFCPANDNELTTLLNEYDTAIDFDSAYAAWEKLQKAASDDHLIVKYGDYYYCDMASSNVENFKAFMGIVLWGINVKQ